MGKGQIKVLEIHHGKRLRVTPIVSRSFEHHTGDKTILLGFTAILREIILEVVRSLPPLFLFHQPLREDLQLNGYLKNPQAAKTLYIYKHPCLL
ncbi:hypothetical protein TNCV_2078101 [Trichonephila clavipes]|nr:hypothetical protein TNCV_2078101 [Trichonephila clavipes]